MATISTKSTADKLLMKTGKTVLFVNAPSGYERSIGKIAAEIAKNQKMKVDVIQVFVKDREQMEAELPRLRKQLNPGGALWVTYYKGTSENKTDINRDSIAEYALTVGLEGVAICSIDDDWTALRCKLIPAV